ncbi:MAG: hypothetical protein HYY41_01775 [Chloroflexi bacterium]|nr:hypothetical protein [Chloroflexota bacterium]
MAILRILHILFGVFVAGYYMFAVPILLPRLKRLGPAIQGPVMQALMPVLTPVMMVSAVVIVGTGIAMTLILRPGNLGTLFTTGWGWAIFTGFILTLVIIVLAFGVIIPTGLRAQKLARVIQGRPPTPDEVKQMGKLSAQVETASNVNFVLVVIVLLAMLLARYFPS